MVLARSKTHHYKFKLRDVFVDGSAAWICTTLMLFLWADLRMQGEKLLLVFSYIHNINICKKRKYEIDMGDDLNRQSFFLQNSGLFRRPEPFIAASYLR